MSRQPDEVRVIKRHLPPQTLAPEAYQALRVLQAKAQRFDAALAVLRTEPAPVECRALADQIVQELTRG